MKLVYLLITLVMISCDTTYGHDIGDKVVYTTAISYGTAVWWTNFPIIPDDEKSDDRTLRIESEPDLSSLDSNSDPGSPPSFIPIPKEQIEIVPQNVLRFDATQVCVPSNLKFTIKNPHNASHSFQVLNIQSNDDQIHPMLWNATAFSEKALAGGESMDIELFFIPYKTGQIESELVIETSIGTMLYRVEGLAISNAFGLNAFIDTIHVGEAYHPDLVIHNNPSAREMLIVHGVYTMDDFLHLNVLNQTHPKIQQHATSSPWMIHHFTSSSMHIAELAFKSTMEGTFDTYIHLWTNQQNFIIPVHLVVEEAKDLSSVAKDLLLYPQLVDFGIFTTAHEEKVIGINLENAGSSDIEIEGLHLDHSEHSLTITTQMDQVLSAGMVVPNAFVFTFFGTEPGFFTGKMTVHARDVHTLEMSFLAVNYQAHVIHGAIVYARKDAMLIRSPDFLPYRALPPSSSRTENNTIASIVSCQNEFNATLGFKNLSIQRGLLIPEFYHQMEDEEVPLNEHDDLPYALEITSDHPLDVWHAHAVIDFEVKVVSNPQVLYDQLFVDHSLPFVHLYQLKLQFNFTTQHLPIYLHYSQLAFHHTTILDHVENAIPTIQNISTMNAVCNESERYIESVDNSSESITKCVSQSTMNFGYVNVGVGPIKEYYFNISNPNPEPTFINSIDFHMKDTFHYILHSIIPSSNTNNNNQDPMVKTQVRNLAREFSSDYSHFSTCTVSKWKEQVIKMQFPTMATSDHADSNLQDWYIPPGYTAVFILKMRQLDHQHEVVDALALTVETPYQIFYLTTSYLALRGRITYGRIKFHPTFPGRVEFQSVNLVNSFRQDIKIKRVMYEDQRLHFVLQQSAIPSHTTSTIGQISFSPAYATGCKDMEYYIDCLFPSASLAGRDATKLTTTSVEKSINETEVLKIQMLHSVQLMNQHFQKQHSMATVNRIEYQKVLQKFQLFQRLKPLSLKLWIETNIVRHIEIDVRAKLKWPRLLMTSSDNDDGDSDDQNANLDAVNTLIHSLWLRSCPLGRICEYYLPVENPGSIPIMVSLATGNLDSSHNDGVMDCSLSKRKNPSDLDSDMDRNVMEVENRCSIDWQKNLQIPGFLFLSQSKRSQVLQPGEHTSLGPFYFKSPPTMYQNHHLNIEHNGSSTVDHSRYSWLTTRVYVRNSYSQLEPIDVHASVGRGELSYFYSNQSMGELKQVKINGKEERNATRYTAYNSPELLLHLNTNASSIYNEDDCEEASTLGAEYSYEQTLKTKHYKRSLIFHNTGAFPLEIQGMEFPPKAQGFSLKMTSHSIQSLLKLSDASDNEFNDEGEEDELHEEEDYDSSEEEDIINIHGPNTEHRHDHPNRENISTNYKVLNLKLESGESHVLEIRYYPTCYVTQDPQELAVLTSIGRYVFPLQVYLSEHDIEYCRSHQALASVILPPKYHKMVCWVMVVYFVMTIYFFMHELQYCRLYTKFKRYCQEIPSMQLVAESEALKERPGLQKNPTPRLSLLPQFQFPSSTSYREFQSLLAQHRTSSCNGKPTEMTNKPTSSSGERHHCRGGPAVQHILLQRQAQYCATATNNDDPPPIEKIDHGIDDLEDNNRSSQIDRKYNHVSSEDEEQCPEESEDEDIEKVENNNAKNVAKAELRIMEANDYEENEPSTDNQMNDDKNHGQQESPSSSIQSTAVDDDMYFGSSMKFDDLSESMTTILPAAESPMTTPINNDYQHVYHEMYHQQQEEEEENELNVSSTASIISCSSDDHDDRDGENSSSAAISLTLETPSEFEVEYRHDVGDEDRRYQDIEQNIENLLVNFEDSVPGAGAISAPLAANECLFFHPPHHPSNSNNSNHNSPALAPSSFGGLPLLTSTLNLASNSSNVHSPATTAGVSNTLGLSSTMAEASTSSNLWTTNTFQHFTSTSLSTESSSLPFLFSPSQLGPPRPAAAAEANPPASAASNKIVRPPPGFL